MVNDIIELIYVLSCVRPFIKLKKFNGAFDIKWKKDWLKKAKEILNNYKYTNNIINECEIVSLIDDALTIVEIYDAKSQEQKNLKKYIIDSSKDIINKYVLADARNTLL